MENSKRKQLNFLNLEPESILKKQYLLQFRKVLDSGNFILGPEVKNFEKRFAKYLGVKFCIGVGNGLEALQISLMSLGIKTGDEIITTPISAIATTLAILAVGAKPVFVDTNANGLIDVDLIPHAITEKTKAILPVHLYGNPVDLDKIQTICKKNNLYLIEDAAQAHGSILMGKKLGTFGDLGCFSFYPTKNLGALGDGGAIVTNNLRIAKICRETRDYGQQKKYLHKRYGLNSRLDEVQAAILSIKLKNLDKENLKRKILAKRYIKNLSRVSEIEIVTKNLNDSNFHLFVIRLKKRNLLQKFLAQNNVQTLIHYPKIITDQPLLKRESRKIDLGVARNFIKECLSLPLYPQMSFEDVDFICSKIVEFYSTPTINAKYIKDL